MERYFTNTSQRYKHWQGTVPNMCFGHCEFGLENLDLGTTVDLDGTQSCPLLAIQGELYSMRDAMCLAGTDHQAARTVELDRVMNFPSTRRNSRIEYNTLLI